MLYLLSFLAAALFPMLLAGYGAHLATIALSDARQRRKAFTIVWGLAILGVLLSAMSQLASYHLDERRDSGETSFRTDVLKRLDSVIHEPNSSQRKVDATTLKTQIEQTYSAKHLSLATPSAHIHVKAFEWHMPTNYGERAEVKISFQNNGKAPIRKLIFAGHAGFCILQAGKVAQLAFEQQMISNAPKVSAVQLDNNDNEVPVGVDRSFTITSSPWTQNAIEVFRSGKAVVYVAGALTYSDFHSTHVTSFCGFMGSDGQMKFCGKFNREP